MARHIPLLASSEKRSKQTTAGVEKGDDDVGLNLGYVRINESDVTAAADGQRTREEQGKKESGTFVLFQI